MPSRPEFAVLVYFAVVASLFAAVVPVYEAPDEPFHLDYVNFLLERGALPDQRREESGVFREGHQPPLYYGLAALLTLPFRGGSAVEVEIERNPQHVLGGGERRDVAYFLHPPEPPFRSPGSRRAYTALRALGIALGAVTLLFTFRISRLLIPDDRWSWLPGAMLATLPQFLFIFSSISSDNLANALAAASIYLALRLLREPERGRHYLLLGVVLGLGLCTKKTTLPLLLPIAAMVFWLLQRGAPGRRQIVARTCLLLAAMLALGGWVYLRNLHLYGDLLGTEMEKRTLSFVVAEQSLLSPYFRWTFWSGVATSFVGRFGWMQIPLPLVVYLGWWLVLGAGIAGAAVAIVREREHRAPILLAAGFGLSNLAGVLYFNMTFPEPQGRYLFPVVSLVAVLAVFGLRFAAARLPAAARIVPVAVVLLGVVSDALALLRIRGFY